MDDPMTGEQEPQYPEYRPPSQRDLDRASLRRILLWLGLAVALFLAALVVGLLDG
jgi:hypothetical protein